MTTLRVASIDLRRGAHRRALIAMLDLYARDPAGGAATALPAEVASRLPDVLAGHPTYHGWLAFESPQDSAAPADTDANHASEDTPIGLINAFLTVSTFRAQPLLNLHDIVVDPAFRRRGVARRMIAQAEAWAREHGCCKLTLEVLSGNAAALSVYRAAGFEPYALDPAMGQALFLQKKFY